MAWTPLSERLGSLPLVLAGPIVRKVKKDSVTVWLAMSGPCTSVSLEIYNTDDTTLPTALEGGEIWAPTQIGEWLYVIAITVTGLSLRPDQLYYYNIFFEYNDGRTEKSLNLKSGGVLNSWDFLDTETSGIDLITYTDQGLPTFVLPSASIDNLKIMHGSCRKIHGGQVAGDAPQTPGYFTSVTYRDIDALSLVDLVLSDHTTDLSERPQQLFLTGDQIYADDVSDLMLYMINDAEQVLVNLPEILPGIDPSLNIGPLRRYNFINSEEYAHMTSGDYSKSHLMKLSEFYCMYLFSWSDALWTDLPDIEVFKSYCPDEDEDDETHFELEDDDFKTYHAGESTTLNVFRASLPNVRRALANIATYMIFDDHEVTDDWFLNETWCRQVMANDLGKRIMQNGLSAYALFQAWGNTPELYNDESTVEFNLRSSLYALTTLDAYDASYWQNIGDLLLPELVSSGTNEEVSQLSGGPDWHYYLDFDYYQVIVLDSRTQRGYNEEGHARLLSTSALENQFATASTDAGTYVFTILIAPAPVVGHTHVEGLQEWLIRLHAKNEATGDYEPWTVDPSTIDGLLRKLLPYKKLIILSGDVHYAFSAQVNYGYNLKDGASAAASNFVQLTSSALRNSDKLTQSGYRKNIGLESLSGPAGEHDYKIDLKSFTKSGWKTAGIKGRRLREVKTVDPDTGTSIRLEIDKSFNVEAYKDYCTDTYSIAVGNKTYRYYYQIVEPPDWSYLISFAEDTRSAEERGTLTYTRGSSSLYNVAATHQAQYHMDRMSLVVGFCNIGQLVFRDIIELGDDGSENVVVLLTHRLWFKPGSGIERGAWTEHSLTL